MKTTFNKTFYVRGNQPKKNGKVMIMVRITINGKKDQFNTGLDVDPTKWIPATGRTKAKDDEALRLNKLLDNILEQINYLYDYFLMQQGYVHPPQIKEAILKTRQQKEQKKEEKVQEENKKTFFEYFDELNETLKPQISQKTYSRYVATKERFATYFTKTTKKKPKECKFEDLTTSLINNFYTELMSKYRIGNNTAMKYMQRLKAAVAFAMDEEDFKDPFRKFKFHFDEADRDFLTIEQIAVIINKKFKSQRLQLVKDMFIFSCFTGLSFAEMCSLSKEDIKETFDGSIWIIDRRKKTKNQFKVRLMEIPKQIIKKYQGMNRNGKLLPMKSNTKMNEYLEEIKEICGIEETITFHVARHTFATLCLTEDVSLSSLKKMLGHKSTRTTEIYARIIDKKLSKDMASLEQNINNLLPNITI